MLKVGQRYRVKSKEELLATPGISLGSDSNYMYFNSYSSIFIISGMSKYYNHILIADNERHIKHCFWYFSEYMLVPCSKKLTMLQAIKDFK